MPMHAEYDVDLTHQFSQLLEPALHQYNENDLNAWRLTLDFSL